MSIQIKPLKNHPEAISTLACLCHERICKHWSPDNTLEEVTSWFQDWMNDSIPLVYICLDGKRAVGMCSLQQNDGIRPDLAPWLGDLCVDPSYEKKGIGKALVNAAKLKAKQEGYHTLYLFAPDPLIPAYYEKLGWNLIGRDIYHGHPVNIMSIIL